MGSSSSKAFDVAPFRVKTMPYEAIVAGSTGATGRRIVESLIASPLCTKITALSRREIPESMYEKTFPDIDFAKAKEKLVVQVVDFDAIVADPNSAPFNVAPTTKAFSALGTAPFSEKVDLQYSNAFAQAMHSKGVKHMALVSAGGANSNSIFGYMKLIGRRQEYFASLNFASLHVAMPGFIDREELGAERLKERILKPITPERMMIRAQTIGRALVAASEADVDGYHEYDNSAMKALEQDSCQPEQN